MKRTDLEALQKAQAAMGANLAARAASPKPTRAASTPKRQKTAQSGKKPARSAKSAAPAKVAVLPKPARAKPELRVIDGDKHRRRLASQRRVEAMATLAALVGGQPPRRRNRRRGVPTADIFKPYQPPAGVLPKDTKFAMDANAVQNVQWAGISISDRYFEGQTFLGYPLLAEMAQRPEYRRISERLATEMTRKWIKLTSNSDDDEGKADKIKELEGVLEELKVREAFQEIATQDGLMGRSHLYIDTGATDTPAELKTPIGNGRNEATRLKITKDSLKAVRPVEAVWCYPSNYNATDPLKPDWFKPDIWYCMGKEIHRTRLITFIGRDVPDLLKPAYAFGGLSLTQMAKPYVDNWLDTRQAIADLINNFSKNGVKTNLMKALMPGGDSDDTSIEGATSELLRRIDLYTQYADNRGIMLLDKDGEEFFQHNTPLGTLDQLQAQSQEHLCSVTGIPVVVLLGLTPHGLNASSDGEIRAFEDWIAAYQRHLFGTGLKTVIDIAMISKWGAIDEDIGFEFVPLHTMDEKEEEDIQKSRADRDGGFVDHGVLDPLEVRRRLANDPKSGYNDIDVEDVPEPPDMGEMGGEPGGAPPGGGQPGEGEGDDIADLAGDEEVDEPVVIPFAEDADWKESDHPRGQPGNPGQFGSGGGTAKAIDPKELTKVGGQKGSNPGGIYADTSGKKLYVKQGQSTDHVKNELLAADLYGLAGARTLSYRPVKGGKHIATEMADLSKDRAGKFTPAEREAAQEDFAVHAWLANWDAVGLGGDNQGVVNGKPVSLDLGGALAYRAQGAPKGKAFGDKVTELDTLRNPKMNPDSAKFFGDMTEDQFRESAKKVTSIPDEKIRAAVKSAGLGKDVADRLIARKGDIAKRAEGMAPAPKTKAPAARSAVPGSVNGTNEERMPLAERQKLRENVKKTFVDAVASKLPAGTEIKQKTYMRPDGTADINVGIRVTSDLTSSAWARINVDTSGNVFIQQHDTNLSEKLKGKGLGGGMIDALINGYKALGAGKGDVPIHINSNPSFWSHMSKKHGGIFSEDAAMASDATPPQDLDWDEPMLISEIAPDVWAVAGWAGDEAGFEESKHPRDQEGKFASKGGGSGSSSEEDDGEAAAEEVIESATKKLINAPSLASFTAGLTEEEKQAVEAGHGSIKEFWETMAGGLSSGEWSVPDPEQGTHSEMPAEVLQNISFENAKVLAEKFPSVDGAWEWMKGAIPGIEEIPAEKIGNAIKWATSPGIKAENKLQILAAMKNSLAAVGPGTPKNGPPKTKKEIIADLLLKGTTAAEVLKATGWPSVSMPQQAKAAGMKLEKVKEGGVVKYKGVPMTDAEKAAAKAESKAKKAEKSSVEPSGPASIATYQSNQVPGYEIKAFKNTSQPGKVNLVTYKDGKPTDNSIQIVNEIGFQAKASEMLKELGGEKPSAAAPKATEAELKTAQKSTKIPWTSLAPEGQKLIDEFNAKYAGKNITDKGALEQKVADFKEMKGKVDALNETHKAEAEAEQKAKAAAAAKEAEAKAAKAKEALGGIMKTLGVSEHDAQAVQGLMELLGTTDPDAALKKVKGLESEGSVGTLSSFETAMIKSYTGSGSGPINSALRKGSWSIKQHIYANTVNKALKKLPAYTGVTKRFADLDASLQSLYQVGNVVEERAFTSTSKNPGWSWGGNTRYYISGKSGRDVSGISNHKNEGEVLYPARTFFKVTKVTGAPGGIMEIHMEEVDYI